MVLVLRVSSGREGLWVTEVWTLLPAGAFMRPQPGLPPLASGQERRESSVDSWMGETEAGGDKPWATGEDQWSQPGSLAPRSSNSHFQHLHGRKPFLLTKVAPPQTILAFLFCNRSEHSTLTLSFSTPLRAPNHCFPLRTLAVSTGEAVYHQRTSSGHSASGGFW